MRRKGPGWISGWLCPACERRIYFTGSVASWPRQKKQHVSTCPGREPNRDALRRRLPGSFEMGKRR